MASRWLGGQSIVSSNKGIFMTKLKRCKRKVVTNDHLTLKKLRTDLNITLKEAGKKIGLSKSGIGAVENGRVALTTERIEEIVKSYGVELIEFKRIKRLFEKAGDIPFRRVTVKSVLTNQDRRSYQRKISKECEVLKSMRRVKKLTQDELSKLCGYPRSTIGHIENGRVELNRERIDHILESMGESLKTFEDNLKKDQMRDQILDGCLDKLESLSEDKLEIVRNLLESF